MDIRVIGNGSGSRFCMELCGYHNRNSNDNMPNLHSIAQMDEAEVNNILSGYTRTQLLEVWGSPEYSNSSEDVWLLDDIACLTVNYKNDSEKVVICGIGPMLFPVDIKKSLIQLILQIIQDS